MCCEIIRKDFKRWKEVQELENSTQPDSPTHQLDASKHTIIQSEVKRLKQLLEFTGIEQHKIVLFLKFILGITFTIEEAEKYLSEHAQSVYSNLHHNKDESLGNKYRILAEITNQYENTNVAGDAIRMWLNKHTSSIIIRLNGTGQSSYDKETLGILLELI